MHALAVLREVVNLHHQQALQQRCVNLRNLEKGEEVRVVAFQTRDATLRLRDPPDGLFGPIIGWWGGLVCLLQVSHLVQVNQDAGDGVQEAGQLVETVVVTVRLGQVHLLAPLDQLRVHQVHVLRTNLFARLRE